SENVAAAGASRHAKTDFTSALADRIGHDSVNSDAGEKESHNREDPQDLQSKPARRHAFRHDLVHRLNSEDGDRGVYRLHLAANCLAENARVRGRPDINDRIVRWALGLGEVDMRRAGRIEAVG